MNAMNKAMIPAIINGTVAGTEIKEELMYLNEAELEALATYGVNFETQGNMFEAVESINDQICVLFALSRPEDAWRAIEENIDTIDYLQISKCMFFQMSRNHTDVYKALWKKTIIDDMSYLYFNIVCGKMDVEFFKSLTMSATCAKDVLDVAFGGANGVNLYELGLVELDPEIRELIFGCLQEGEQIGNYVIGSAAVFEFTAKDMLELMKGFHIEESIIPQMIQVIANRGAAVADEHCTAEMYEFVSEHYEGWFYQPCLMMDLTMLTEFIEIYASSTFIQETIGVTGLFSVIVNSDSYVNWYSTILHILDTNLGSTMMEAFRNIQVAEYLSDRFMHYVHAIKTIVDDRGQVAQDFIMGPAFPQGFTFGCNKMTEMVNVNGRLMSIDAFVRVYAEACDSSFIGPEDRSGIRWAIEVVSFKGSEDLVASTFYNDNLMSRLNSEEEYYELARGVLMAAEKIVDHYESTHTN